MAINNLLINLFRHRKVSNFAGVIAAIALCLSMRAEAQTSFTSTVEEPTDRPWIGLGYNQDPLDRDSTGGLDVTPWSDAHWSLLTQRMAAIKPAVVRIMISQDWFNSAHTVGAYHWDSAQMQALYKVLDWYKANNIAILTGTWSLTLASHGNPWGYANAEDSAKMREVIQTTEYAQIQADLFHQLRVVKGYTNIEFYTPYNEPRGLPGFTYAMYHNCIKNLAASFLAKGLPTHVITGADSWDEFIYEAPKFSSQILGTYESHAYAESEAVVSGNVEKNLRGVYGASVYQYDNTKPTMIGEMAATDVSNVDMWYQKNPLPADAGSTYSYGLNTFDHGIQVIRSGQSSALLWALDGYGYGGHANGKDCGMWSWSTTNPTLGGTKLRPHYYSWSLLCQYFPRGMTMYRMSQPAGNSIRIAAGQQLQADGSSHWTIAMVNQSDTAQDITVKIPGWAGGDFDLFSYAPTHHGDGSSLEIPSTTVSTNSLENSGVVVSVPAKSGALLSTLKRSAVKVSIFPGMITLFDPLVNLSRCHSSSHVALDDSQNWLTAGDKSRAHNNSTEKANLVYHLDNLSDFKVRVYGYNGAESLSFCTSPDGVHWSPVSVTPSQKHATLQSWKTFYYVPNSVIPLGNHYLKIEYPAGSSWPTQIGDVTIYTERQPKVLRDQLVDAEKMFSHANLLYLNHGNQPILGSINLFSPANNTENAAMVYRYPNAGTFDVRVFGAKMDANNKLQAFASPDNSSWTPIAMRNSAPEQNDGYWADSHYTPFAALPPNTHFLKFVLINNDGVQWTKCVNNVTIYPFSHALGPSKQNQDSLK